MSLAVNSPKMSGTETIKAEEHHQKPLRQMDVFIAGDDARAKAGVAEFVESLNLRPLDVGGLNMAHWLEGTSLVLMGLARHGVGTFDVALGVNVSG